MKNSKPRRRNQRTETRARQKPRTKDQRSPTEKEAQKEPRAKVKEAVKRRSSNSNNPTADTLRTLRFAPEPLLDVARHRRGRVASLAIVQAGPPAADCGTASPCGGRLYGGPGRALTFGRRGNLWINRRSHRHLQAMRRNQPTDSASSFDIRGMDPKTALPTFFTERSLAAYLAVSDRTIRNWIRRGELPSYKLGAARRIDPADVDTFLARRREGR